MYYKEQKKNIKFSAFVSEYSLGMTKMANAQDDRNRDRGPALMAIFWTECIVAMGIVSLRCYARVLIGRLGVDDWVMVATVVRGFLFFFVCIFLFSFLSFLKKIEVWTLPDE